MLNASVLRAKRKRPGRLPAQAFSGVVMEETFNEPCAASVPVRRRWLAFRRSCRSWLALREAE